MTTNTTNVGSKTPEFDPRVLHNSIYIEETKRVLLEYIEHQSFDKVEYRVEHDNILNKQRAKYRLDVLRKISRLYIPSRDQFVETPLMRAIISDADESVIDWIIYYEFSQNPLIHNLTTNFLFEEYDKGTMYLDTPTVQDYITELRDNHPEINEWGDSIIKEASTRYLSSLKNFGLLRGGQKKEFAVYYIPDEVVAYVYYRIIDNKQPTSEEIVTDPNWKLFLFDEQEARRRLEGISPQYIRYERRGSTERIEPVFTDIWEVIDEF